MKGCHVVCQCRVDVARGQEMERPGLRRDIISLEESRVVRCNHTVSIATDIG